MAEEGRAYTRLLHRTDASSRAGGSGTQLAGGKHHHSPPGTPARAPPLQPLPSHPAGVRHTLDAAAEGGRGEGGGGMSSEGGQESIMTSCKGEEDDGRKLEDTRRKEEGEEVRGKRRYVKLQRKGR